jgi:predicted ATP-dependent endonuclease of OLD family
MKLSKLELQNFRAFEHATVTFPDSGVLMIAGANNSGKSALLSGIDAIVGQGFGDETQHYGSQGPAQIEAVFTLDDEERQQLLKEVRSGIELDAFKEVNWKFEYSGSVFTPVQVSTPWTGRDGTGRDGTAM